MGNQMPKEDLKKAIRDFLDKRKILVLCTCLDNTPRATPIEENPNISIGIYTPMDTGKIQGMQITASGKENLVFLREGDEEFDKVQKIVRGKRNLLLKIIPEKIELLDYDFVKEGYSRLQYLEF